MKSLIPINDFKQEQLNYLIKQFSEAKIGTLVINSDIKNEEAKFFARLKEKSTKRFWVEAKSIDAHHAKEKFINKLREKLQDEKNKNFTKPVSFARKAIDPKKELQTIDA